MQMSHQRVHQIIDGAVCSFCDARQADVARLIAGPGVFICDRCLMLALRVIASERDASDDRTIIQQAAAGPSVKCSFCRKKAKRVGRMAERSETRICSHCLSLCTQVIASS
jgi:ATP-dependent protease Clp ATPase subunit